MASDGTHLLLCYLKHLDIFKLHPEHDGVDISSKITTILPFEQDKRQGVIMALSKDGKVAALSDRKNIYTCSLEKGIVYVARRSVELA